VYADWLTDQGQDDRAELIRLQIARSRLDEWDVRQVALARREEALLAEHGRAWVGEEGIGEYRFRRGFLECLTISKVGPDVLRRLLAGHPVRELEVRGPFEAGLLRDADVSGVERLSFDYATGDIPGALRSPCWSRLVAVHVTSGEEADEAAAVIAASSWAGGLRELRLAANGLGTGGIRTLLAGGGLSALTSLDVSINEQLAGRGVVALATSTDLPALRKLDLYAVGLVGTGARRLAANPLLGRLQELHVGGNGLAGGAADLVSSPHVAALKSLALPDCRLGRGGLAALASSPHLAALRSLDVGQSSIGPEALRTLMASEALVGLEALCLGNNPVGSQGAALLASDANPWKLRSLDLRFCGLGDEGAAALDAPRLAGLRELTLHANEIEADGAMRLAEARHLRGLRRLGLKNNRVGPQGADALARTKYLDLLTLELETNPLSTRAKAALRTRYGSGVTFSA